ncbi:Uncharacterised protein [Bordetella pertussis]|nr:Uncharacterised protein [Bordetella pertussis]
MRARKPSLVSRCSATCRCRSHTLNQPPLPSQSGYWIKPSSTSNTRNSRRIRGHLEQTRKTAVSGRAAMPRPGRITDH